MSMADKASFESGQWLQAEITLYQSINGKPAERCIGLVEIYHRGASLEIAFDKGEIELCVDGDGGITLRPAVKQ